MLTLAYLQACKKQPGSSTHLGAQVDRSADSTVPGRPESEVQPKRPVCSPELDFAHKPVQLPLACAAACVHLAALCVGG